MSEADKVSMTADDIFALGFASATATAQAPIGVAEGANANSSSPDLRDGPPRLKIKKRPVVEGIIGKRILVVDDVELNRKLLIKMLSSRGVICIPACDGSKAVEACESALPFDAIIMVSTNTTVTPL
jgi:PleD family two-component response regulator